jgi:hypothetical protein
MNLAATTPGRPPPKVTPENMRTNSVARMRRGAYSLINAVVIGNTPAMPMPAMNRSTIRVVRSCARTEASVNRPKKSKPPKMAVRRP